MVEPGIIPNSSPLHSTPSQKKTGTGTFQDVDHLHDPNDKTEL